MDSALALGGNGQQQQMEGSAMDSLAMDGSESSKMQRWTARDGQLAMDSSQKNGLNNNGWLGAMEGSAMNNLRWIGRLAMGRLGDGARHGVVIDLVMDSSDGSAMEWTARRRNGRLTMDRSAWRRDGRLAKDSLDSSAMEQWTARRSDGRFSMDSSAQHGRLRVAMDSLRWTAWRNLVMDGRLAIDS